MPHKLSQRILYLSIVFISTKYSIDTYLNLADISLTHHSKSFDTLDDIFSSKLPIYGAIDVIRNLNDNREINIELINKIKIMSRKECLMKLLSIINVLYV